MIRLVPLSRECLAALHRGDLELAGTLCELSLPDAFLDERQVWGYFAGKLESNPNIEGWLVNAVVRPDGEAPERNEGTELVFEHPA